MALIHNYYVNILDYGAIGDNSTNNATALANAVATGLPVYVPKGDFKFGTGITLADNQVIFGDGDVSHLIYTGTTRGITVGNKSKVQNLKIEGNGKASGNPFESGIFCYQVIEWSIESCTVVGFGGNPTANGGAGIEIVALGVSNQEGGRIINCFIDNNNAGINIEARGEYVVTSNCLITNNTCGFACAAGNISLSNSNIEKNTTGIKLYSGTNNGHGGIDNCTVNHNTTNLNIDSVAMGMSFVNCSFYVGDIAISNSNGIKFSNCDIGATATITLTNNTNLYRSTCLFPSGITVTLVSGEDFTAIMDVDLATNNTFAQLTSDSYKIIDLRATTKGLEYNADYSAGYTSRTLVDKGYVDNAAISGYSGFSGKSGYSGYSGISGYSGFSGVSGYSGISGYSGYSGISGYSGFSGANPGASGYSGFSGLSGYSGYSGYSGISGYSGYSGYSGISGYSGYSGISGYSGYSGQNTMAFTTQTDTDYTLALTDAATGVKMSSSSAHTLTVPPNSSVAFPIGSQVVIEQAGTGGVTIVAGAGVTINAPSLVMSGQYSVVALVKQATDTWLLTTGVSGYSGYSGQSGYSGYSGSGVSGYSGYSGISGYSGFSGISGYSGYSGLSGYSGFSGLSGYSGYSGISGYSGFSGFSGLSGYSGYSGTSTIVILAALATANTTTSTSLVDLSGLSLALTSGTWQFETMILGQSSTTAGVKFAIAYSGSTTSIEAGQEAHTSGTAFAAFTRITAFATGSTTCWTTATTEVNTYITGQVVVSGSGNLTVQGNKVTSGTLTYRSSSWLKAIKIA